MSIFSTEGKLAAVLNRIGDLIVLNLLTLICMIPVITAGAAFTALYEITMKMVKNEEGPVISSFFRAFGSNFKKSTIIWACAAGITAFLALDIKLLGTLNTDWAYGYRIGLFILELVVLMFTAFILVTSARFENSIKNTVKNGILFCAIHFSRSILMFFVMLIPVILVFISPRFLCVVILFGVSGPAFLTGIYFRSLFKDFE